MLLSCFINEDLKCREDEVGRTYFFSSARDTLDPIFVAFEAFRAQISLSSAPAESTARFGESGVT